MTYSPYSIEEWGLHTRLVSLKEGFPCYTFPFPHSLSHRNVTSLECLYVVGPIVPVVVVVYSITMIHENYTTLLLP